MWAPDPSRRHAHRWWDGQRWTDHVLDGQTQGLDPLTGPPVPVAAPEASRKRPVRWPLAVMGVMGAVVLVGVVTIGAQHGSVRPPIALTPAATSPAPTVSVEPVTDGGAQPVSPSVAARTTAG